MRLCNMLYAGSACRVENGIIVFHLAIAIKMICCILRNNANKHGGIYVPYAKSSIRSYVHTFSNNLASQVYC